MEKNTQIVLFAGSMIIYIEKPKALKIKLLETISQNHNVAGFKINTQKSVAFLHVKIN